MLDKRDLKDNACDIDRACTKVRGDALAVCSLCGDLD